MTAFDQDVPQGAYADFTRVEDLLDKAMALELAQFTALLDRRHLAGLPDALLRTSIWWWLHVVLPEECASVREYLSDVYTGHREQHLLRGRMRVAVTLVADLYDARGFLPALLERVGRMPRLEAPAPRAVLSVIPAAVTG